MTSTCPPPLALVSSARRLDPRAFAPYFRKVKPVPKAGFAPDVLVPAVKTAFVVLGGGGGGGVSRGELARAEKVIAGFPNAAFVLLHPSSTQLQAWVAAHAPGALVFFAPQRADVARIVAEDAVPLLAAMQADGGSSEPATVLMQTADYALRIRWDDLAKLTSDVNVMAQAIAECCGVPAVTIAGVLKRVGSLQALAFLTRGQLREDWGLSRSQANAVAEFLDEAEIEAPLLLDDDNEDGKL